jgi:hypothetical protein
MFEPIPDSSMQLPSLYETDFAEWIDATVQQLKERRFAELDLDNLIEEIESLGKRDKRELQSRLIVLLSHLLKDKYQPEKRSNSWFTTIAEQRRQMLLILQDSPSLRNYCADIFEKCYATARKDAARETQLAIGSFPEVCPFTLENILDEDWFPAA